MIRTKKFTYWLAIMLVIIGAALPAKAQRRDFNKAAQDSTKTQVYTSVSFGRDLWGNSFNTQMFGVDYSQKLNSKTTLYVGANIFNVSGARQPEDKAPRRTTTSGSLYIGATYQFNDKLMVQGDVFFNTIYNSIGANVDMIYKIGEKSFLTLSATFIRSNPSTYHQTIPYWYDDTFQPAILNY